MININPIPLTILVGIALSSNFVYASGALGVDLPDAKPGECYAKAIIPAKYETHEEEMVVREASERVEIIPARYNWVEESIRIKDPAYRLVSIPASYKTDRKNSH